MLFQKTVQKPIGYCLFAIISSVFNMSLPSYLLKLSANEQDDFQNSIYPSLVDHFGEENILKHLEQVSCKLVLCILLLLFAYIILVNVCGCCICIVYNEYRL
jgi:hypothetical protein